MEREKLIQELEKRIRFAAGGTTPVHADVLMAAVEMLRKYGNTLNRLRNTMEDMVRGNASEEVSYLLRLLDKWE